MRISRDKTVAGKMLAHRRAAARFQAAQQRAGEIGYDDRVRVEGTVADDGARRVVEIEDRREAEVDVVCPQFARDGDTVLERRLVRGSRIAVPLLAERPHRRYRREPVSAKPLHAPAFVVDGNEQRRPQRADRSGQAAQLDRSFEVALEEDYAANPRIGKPRTIAFSQRQSFDAQHDRPASRSLDRSPRSSSPWLANCRAHRAAWRINAFISRTASRNPTNTLRDTIACPICNSRTPVRPATGWTLM